MKLLLSAEAATDLQRLHAFLNDKSPEIARRAVEVLTGAVESLATLPERGRPSGIVGIRELIVPFGQSAYVLRYFHKPNSDAVVILRIWHGREARG